MYEKKKGNKMNSFGISEKDIEIFLDNIKNQRISNNRVRNDDTSFDAEMIRATEDFSKQHGDEFYEKVIKS
jgi:hypothetical protein